MTTQLAATHPSLLLVPPLMFLPVSQVSSPLFAAKEGRLSLRLPASQRRNSDICGRAFIYHSSGFRIPTNAEKPEWWWRALSCVPYLIALQTSAAGIYLEPILEKFPLFQSLIFTSQEVSTDYQTDSVDFKQFHATYTLQGNIGNVLLGWCGIGIYFCNDKVHKVRASGYICEFSCT
ncbi:hypothetical protein ACSQ67_025970 [Phaseolus vulgaris]